jgi:hypothetical protein
MTWRVDPWRVRGVEVRGVAEALADVYPPMPGLSREVFVSPLGGSAAGGSSPVAPDWTAGTSRPQRLRRRRSFATSVGNSVATTLATVLTRHEGARPEQAPDEASHFYISSCNL